MIIGIRYGEGLAYAAGELSFFLQKYTKEAVVFHPTSCDRSVLLAVDEAKEAHAYSLTGNGKALSVCGGSASSVLCGVYEALADGGILFEATGHSLPFSFDTEGFFRLNKEVKPAFRRRGVRQHLNFPMDISSYSVEEAKEYVRALARMRYNAVTFHSYPGQWYDRNAKGQSDHAGHFFYGQVHPVPRADALTASRIRNREIFCIPEAEPLFHDAPARGEFAKAWLLAVISTAKEAYMEVTLSVEITFDGDEAIVSMLRSLAKTYPLIDTLELLSEECGGNNHPTPPLTAESVKDFMTKTFGKDILTEEGELPGLPRFVPGQLGAAAVSVRRVLRALELREGWLSAFEKAPQLRVGIYTTCPDTLRILRPILRRRTPQGVTMSLLPAHGAVTVANNIEQTGTTEEDWQSTMFYSWAEFDGNMYIQQLSTDGLERLVSLPAADSAYGFCINHWRTAENSLTISYAAEAAITRRSTADFYRAYAKKVGIVEKEGFAKACERLASLDTYNRDKLFNIGFCYRNCWINKCRRGDMIAPRAFPADCQAASIEAYESIVSDLEKLLPATKTKEGGAFIRLLINRCKTSALHIRALLTLDKILSLYDYADQKPLTKDQADAIGAILAEARAYAIGYLHLYGEILPDRGAEGLMVSYYETIVAFIDAVAQSFDKKKEEIPSADYDAPPLPDAQV